jgi:glycine oxidase
VKSWDAIVLGAGIIGVSVARALRQQGMEVLLVERGEPGREASFAAAGMLAPFSADTPDTLWRFAEASARLYPAFVKEVENHSGMQVDLRSQGTIAFLESQEELLSLPCLPELGASQLAELEPDLVAPEGRAFFLDERSVDARALMTASLEAARNRQIQILSGVAATGVETTGGRTLQVTTEHERLQAPIVVNCTGAWAGQVPPHKFPTRPVKGQMLAVSAPADLRLRHAVRAPGVYVVPRSDGRILIGATQEEAGFDRSVDAKTIERLHQAAAALFPALGSAPVLESWAGLRPGTPDALPIMGATATPGYFVAAGHFRNGFLLAPLTAQTMAAAVRGSEPSVDITRFSPSRFDR